MDMIFTNMYLNIYIYMYLYDGAIMYPKVLSTRAITKIGAMRTILYYHVTRGIQQDEMMKSDIHVLHAIEIYIYIHIHTYMYMYTYTYIGVCA